MAFKHQGRAPPSPLQNQTWPIFRSFVKEIYKNEDTSSSNILEGCHYQQLCGIILDLYIDNAKFSGKSATGRVRKLEEALNKKDFNSVLKLFS